MIRYCTAASAGRFLDGTPPCGDTDDMLITFLIMVVGFTLTFYWLLLRRLQVEIIEREGNARWIRELAAEGAP